MKNILIASMLLLASFLIYQSFKSVQVDTVERTYSDFLEAQKQNQKEIERLEHERKFIEDSMSDYCVINEFACTKEKPTIPTWALWIVEPVKMPETAKKETPVAKVESKPVVEPTFFAPVVYADDWRTEITQKKHAFMVEKWFTDSEARYIIDVCKSKSNPERCVQLATHIARHETKVGTKGVWATHNNLFWLRRNGRLSFDKRIESFEYRVVSYEKYRRNNNCTTMVTRSKYTATQSKEWINNCYRMVDKFTSL